LVFTSGISGKTFFFVSPNVDPVEEDNIAQFGQTPGGGVDSLFESSVTALKDYIPQSRLSAFTNLRQISASSGHGHFESTRVLDAQLIFGILPEEQTISGEAAFADEHFVVRRSQQQDAISQLQSGRYRDVLVVGEFVSGKSATALSITSEFIRSGYKAYFATHGPNLSSELERLARFDDRVIVVFEGYSTFRRTISDYAAIRNPRHRLVMTEQAVQHELHSDFLYSASLVDQVYELTLDRISDADSVHFARIINFGGYWRERSGASDETNARYISSKLDGSLYRLLTEIIESEEIQDRVSKILGPLQLDRRATEVFVAACIVSIVGVPFRVAEWSAAFDQQFVKSVVRNYADELRYFLVSQSGNIFPRSGLLSASILSRIIDRSVILDAAVKLFTVAARVRTPFDMYDDIYVRLMQFNRLQPIMGGPNQKELIFTFYERIRPISETHKNPDYWLQLGIAATALDELSIAGDAFENAYAREQKKPKPNFKRIDNYFSRYLLAYAASLTDSQDAFEVFVGAAGGLKKQMNLEDNRHYPFKSGRMYGEIAHNHFHHWRSDQQEIFISETRDINEKAKEYERQHPGQSLDVEVLIRETNDLLKRLALKENGRN
jgi:hypothetical protein